MLRLAALIHTGAVPPGHPQEARSLSPPGRAAPGATGNEKVGGAIFTCDWLLDLELRSRSNGNLNKGESRHALVRAVFFHRLGELRDRTAKDMARRASGLNLVVNAIVWNTTYLSHAIAYVRGQGRRAHQHGHRTSPRTSGQRGR